MNGIVVSKLRCEYKQNPLGIDIEKPRLSCLLVSDARNVLQGAYQLQVSTADPLFVSPFWDSGKVASDQSVHVEYGGAPLQSRTRYHTECGFGIKQGRLRNGVKSRSGKWGFCSLKSG